MKRAAVFAHYDKDNLIDDYVIYYLKALRQAVDYIVFVSCCDISDAEKLKLKDIADYLITEKHDEYDFGSYKRGFFHLQKNANDFDEILFINDSCFGPFKELKPMLDEMTTEQCDFWAITRNCFGYVKRGKHYAHSFVPHLQSYFLVFKKPVFTSKVFINFMKSITAMDCKKEVIINYEIALTPLLINSGFKPDWYIKKYQNVNNSTILRWRELILKCNMPLMKCSLPRLKNRNNSTVEGYQDVIKKVSDYPTEIIEANAKRIENADPVRNPINLGLRRWIFYVVSSMPFCVRKICEIIIKRYLPFILDKPV